MHFPTQVVQGLEINHENEINHILEKLIQYQGILHNRKVHLQCTTILGQEMIVFQEAILYQEAVRHQKYLNRQVFHLHLVINPNRMKLENQRRSIINASDLVS